MGLFANESIRTGAPKARKAFLQRTAGCSLPVLRWISDVNVDWDRHTMSADAKLQAAVGYLVPAETVVETSGTGARYELGPLAGKSVLIVLRIDDIVEQESLEVSVWGSADGADWGAHPLFVFPQKFYCGVTPAALDLGQRPEIRFLQTRWDVNRWGRGYPRPYFRFAVEIQELTPQ